MGMIGGGRESRSHGDFKLSIIGDEDTVVGFLLGGIGMKDGVGRTNFFVVDDRTNNKELEEKFKELVEKKDIAILLINQHVADRIRYLVDLHIMAQPVIIELPSKDKEWDPNSDALLKRVQVYYGGRLPDTCLS